MYYPGFRFHYLKDLGFDILQLRWLEDVKFGVFWAVRFDILRLGCLEDVKFGVLGALGH